MGSYSKDRELFCFFSPICINLSKRESALKHLRLIPLALALALALVSCSTDEGPLTFRQNWKTASRYASSHRNAWQQVWQRYDVPADVAEAVIFPELVRFNFWQDMAEVSAVESGYIPGGTEGCDYSIGRFQMKPSFIEDLEKRWMRSELAEPYGLSYDTADTEAARQARFDRLSSEEGQAVYLAVYLRMLFLDYGSKDRDGNIVQEGLDTLPPVEQVRLAATAYNHGTLWRSPGTGSLDRIRAVTAEQKFPLPNLFRTRMRYYSYGDLAARYYAQVFQ